jgi:hypothetical protein
MRLLAIAALLLPVPSIAAPAAAQKTDSEKMVCKAEQRAASRATTKTCKTAAEWEAIAEQAKRDVGEIAGKPRINPVGCGGSRAC